ncbi:hypothetical protein ACS0PU_003069 [Formica fusca]
MNTFSIYTRRNSVTSRSGLAAVVTRTIVQGGLSISRIVVSRTASYPQTKDRGGKAVISSLYYVTQMHGSGDLETSVFILRLRRHCAPRYPKRVLGGLPSREGLRHSGVADWLIPLSTAMVICTHFLHIFLFQSLIVTCRLRKRDIFDGF